MEEVKAYLIIIIVSVVCIFFNILKMSTSAVNAITDSAFQVASIITTTGFSTTDFNLWPEASKTILIILMFIGACAGSTGGGIKVSRLVILIKSLGKETDSYIHPKIIKKIKMDGKPVEHEVVRSVNVYFLTFIISFLSPQFPVSYFQSVLFRNINYLSIFELVSRSYTSSF